MRIDLPLNIRKFAYCPICDKEMFFYTEDTMARCPICNHHLNLHEEDELKKKMYLGNCEELDCEFFQWSGDSYMDRNTTCYCLKNNRCIDRDMVDEDPHIDCPLGKVLEDDEE